MAFYLASRPCCTWVLKTGTLSPVYRIPASVPAIDLHTRCPYTPCPVHHRYQYPDHAPSLPPPAALCTPTHSHRTLRPPGSHQHTPLSLSGRGGWGVGNFNQAGTVNSCRDTLQKSEPSKGYTYGLCPHDLLRLMKMTCHFPSWKKTTAITCTLQAPESSMLNPPGRLGQRCSLLTDAPTDCRDLGMRVHACTLTPMWMSASPPDMFLR